MISSFFPHATVEQRLIEFNLISFARSVFHQFINANAIANTNERKNPSVEWFVCEQISRKVDVMTKLKLKLQTRSRLLYSV